MVIRLSAQAVLVLCCLATAWSTALSSGINRFNCTAYNASSFPTNIAQLNPAHVGFVMAMGDSITAAFAVRSNLNEGRDISWSAGAGSSDQVTLPFFIRQYNPGLQGYSTKPVLPRDITHLPHGDYHPKTDHLNVAESSGAVHRGSLDEQWRLLTEAVTKYGDSFESSWKVLTLWMTANDVCGQCGSPLAGSAYLSNWVNKTDELIYNISTHPLMKKIYVNLVSTLDLSNVHRIQQSKVGCKIEHKLILKECGCIDRGNSTQLEMLDRNIHTMDTSLHQLAAKWYNSLKNQNRTDMAVVMQSFMQGIGASLDATFLNKLDCFHPSEEGHSLLATGLWNSMLCTQNRQNRCGEHFSKDMVAVCPTKDSVFYSGPDVIPGPPLA